MLDHDRLLHWVNIAKLGLVRIDSVNKDYTKESKTDRDRTVDSINYVSRIESGWYDNCSGVAVRCGWTIGHQYFAIGIDLDGWDAVKAWFHGDSDSETWDNVLDYAKKYLIECHKNKASLHLIIYLKEPIEGVKIPLPGHTKEDRRQIEIQGEGQLLCVSPSKHEDGNQLTPIDSDVIPIINGVQLIGLKAKIDKLYRDNTFKDYLNEHENQSIYEWLHDPKTIFHEGQGRHNWTLWIVNSYYWKWAKDWLDLSDTDRFEKAWEWHNTHCDPPRSRDEFDKMCDDVKNKFREVRDKKHEEVRERREYSDSIPGCISYQINTSRFIVGTPDYKVAEIVKEYRTDKSSGKVELVTSQVKTFTACKPVRVIKHNNPLSFLDPQTKYTIEFKGSEPSGCFTIKHKTLAEIISRLKDGNALTDKGIDYAIQAQLKGFEKAEQLEINDSLDYTGFFPDVGNKIISSNVEIPDKYPDVSDALDFIDELCRDWYVGREDFLAHILLWFMIAPASFIFKVINAPLLDWVHPWGNPNTGKTSSGLIGLSFDANENNEDFNLNMKHIDTLARFGDTISKTTFPTIINEVDLSDERQDYIVTNIITAVDAIKFRKTLDRNTRHVDYCPGLTPLFLTGNPKAPTKPEYLKRVKTRFSREKEIHYPDSEEAKKYKKWLASNLKRDHVLGQFRNKFIMDNQSIILDTNLTPFEKSKKIWTAIYESKGRKLPDIFNRQLDVNQMSDSVEERKGDVLDALQSWIIDKCRQLDTTPHDEKKILEYGDNVTRLTMLVDRRLISYVKLDVNRKFIFLRQLVVELGRYGVKQLDLPGLADAIKNSEYGKKYHGYKVVKCSIPDLEAAFEPSGDLGDEGDPAIT